MIADELVRPRLKATVDRLLALHAGCSDSHPNETSGLRTVLFASSSPAMKMFVGSRGGNRPLDLSAERIGSRDEDYGAVLVDPGGFARSISTLPFRAAGSIEPIASTERAPRLH